MTKQEIRNLEARKNKQRENANNKQKIITNKCNCQTRSDWKDYELTENTFRDEYE